MLVAQISDIHAKDGAASMDRLARAVAYLVQIRPDAVVISGDVASKPHDIGYGLVRAALSPLDMPLLMIPGNADRRDDMRAAFPEQQLWSRDGDMHCALALPGVHLIGFDVMVEGTTHGEATPERLDWLAGELARAEAPALIVMHQQPFATRSAVQERQVAGTTRDWPLLLRRRGQGSRVLCAGTATGRCLPDLQGFRP